MYLLSIAVISHERPEMLGKMLSSLDEISRQDMFEVYVCDNSVLKKDLIKDVCDSYAAIGYFSDPGCSQRQNFINALKFSNSKFISFSHDDDYFNFKSEDINLIKETLNKSKQDKIFYFSSISFSFNKPYFLYKFKGRISKPYSLGSFPFKLPVFPSIVYPKTKKFIELFNSYHQNNFDCGKYSDIPFVESVLEMYKYRCSTLAGFYVHIVHPLNDSSTTDYISRFKLILHTFKKINFLKYPKFIVDILIHTTYLILKKLF